MPKMHRVRRASPLCVAGACVAARRGLVPTECSAPHQWGGGGEGLAIHWTPSCTDQVFRWATCDVLKHNMKVKKGTLPGIRDHRYHSDPTPYHGPWQAAGHATRGVGPALTHLSL